MANNTPLSPGTVLRSHKRDYTVIKMLGSGGFGITYLVEGTIEVENIRTTAYFAIKEHFISSLCERDNATHAVTFSGPVEETVTRSLKAFVKEARRLQSLGINHDNVVRINEVFEANNTAYYVMEYLDGETLRDYVRRCGALPYNEALAVMRPIVDAVATLHKNRLTHYDIKPGNIILAKGSAGRVRPVLIDFGLSKHYDEEGCDTSTLNSKGYSPGYSPVEQYMGLRDFTPQADVYALAATLCFCLTGQSPEAADRFRIDDMAARLRQVAPSNVVEAISRAMTYSKDTRTYDAEKFYNQLYGDSSADRTVLNHEMHAEATQRVDDSTRWENPVTPQQTQSTPNVPPVNPEKPTVTTPVPRRRSRAGLWIGAVILIILIGGNILSLLTNKKQTPDKSEQTEGTSTETFVGTNSVSTASLVTVEGATPELYALADRMIEVQDTYDVVVNNGEQPSEDMVKQMKDIDYMVMALSPQQKDILINILTAVKEKLATPEVAAGN